MGFGQGMIDPFDDQFHFMHVLTWLPW
jgi:hypothetical protein